MTVKSRFKWLFSFFIISLLVYYYFPDKKLPANVIIDNIVIIKSKRTLYAYSKNKLIKSYKISLGANPIGDKEIEGDKKTPEGLYFINTKNDKSHYHKNLGISFPNKKDIETARKYGKSAGGNIKIHGINNKFWFVGKFQRWMDWTAGCIALTDKEIDELYDAVIIGTQVEIKP